jgi:hypothetical protein
MRSFLLEIWESEPFLHLPVPRVMWREGLPSRLPEVMPLLGAEQSHCIERENFK